MLPKVVGLITARGGSKGIPQKNIRLLAGKPLVAWTIEAALQSCGLERVIVSTDDKEIADVAQQWGAEVPFMRPAELAQDVSSHISVVTHAIRWLEECDHYYPDYVMLLQPTSPLRTTEDIDAAIQIAEQHHALAVVSVCQTHHPYLCRQVLEDGTLGDFMPNSIGYLCRQALPRAYANNGAIYLNQCQSLISNQTLWPKGTHAYIMHPERSIDIDTPWDFYLVELILRDRFKSALH